MREAARKVRVECEINGKKTILQTYPMARLLDVLREEAGLTGTKEGCGEGECGACAILLDGVLVNSCLIPAFQANGADLVTIEGLASDGNLQPIQQAFLDEEAFQCGYCTSGMIMASHALLAAVPKPSDEDIFDHMNGNICRCGTYQRIMAAIHRAAEKGGKA